MVAEDLEGIISKEYFLYYFEKSRDLKEILWKRTLKFFLESNLRLFKSALFGVRPVIPMSSVHVSKNLSGECLKENFFNEKKSIEIPTFQNLVKWDEFQKVCSIKVRVSKMEWNTENLYKNRSKFFFFQKHQKYT